ncbi:MAG: alpha/beta fold hydrolase [Candidatus Scalindua sp.]|nr:alpha/beta fold hydrolase [Candidatus Scalindua sp.]
MIEEQVNFKSDGLKLEGVLSYHENMLNPRLMLLCSPHPHLGGDMENNVITSLGNGLAEKGYATLRFNYRGVGNSESRFDNIADKYNYWENVLKSDDCSDALIDAVSALDYLVSSVDNHEVYVAGYSFGAVVAMRLSVMNENIKACASISTPFTRFDFSFLSGCVRPKLFICADNDFATSVDEVKEGMKNIPEPKILEIIEDCDHFYIEREPEIANKVYNFFNSIHQPG